jgi:hypothetical protein
MKERYVRMRNEKVIDWLFIYDYAVSKGFTLGVEKFNIGANYLNMTMHEILNQLDHEYELTILYDKQGIFIKVVL